VSRGFTHSEGYYRPGLVGSPQQYLSRRTAQVPNATWTRSGPESLFGSPALVAMSFKSSTEIVLNEQVDRSRMRMSTIRRVEARVLINATHCRANRSTSCYREFGALVQSVAPSC
jgi:hypothetical protein